MHFFVIVYNMKSYMKTNMNLLKNNFKNNAIFL